MVTQKGDPYIIIFGVLKIITFK